MAKVELKYPITQDTYGGRFSPRGLGREIIHREDDTFQFEYEQPGENYQGRCSTSHDGGSITLTKEELAAIRSHPDDDSWSLAHSIVGECDAYKKVAIIRYLRKYQAKKEKKNDKV